MVNFRFQRERLNGNPFFVKKKLSDAPLYSTFNRLTLDNDLPPPFFERGSEGDFAIKFGSFTWRVERPALLFLT